MIFDGERIIIGVTDKALVKLHIDRYEFASKFVKDKKVLDIACGTGYGSSLLKKSGAKEVPFKRKKVTLVDPGSGKKKRVDAVVVDCDSCGFQINVTKKMK